MNCPENKLKELSGPTPDSFYINGKKLYTEAYVQELERQLEVAINASADLWQVRKELKERLTVAIEALERIANPGYTMKGMESCAREALAKIQQHYSENAQSKVKP